MTTDAISPDLKTTLRRLKLSPMLDTLNIHNLTYEAAYCPRRGRINDGRMEHRCLLGS
jgi:hypothetical protein